jgi:regulatory protein
MANLDSKAEAFQTALRILAASPKSQQEMARRLAQKGYSENVIGNTLQELQNQHLINDQQYAQDLVNRYVVGRPSGRRRIAFELKRRGIPPEICQDALQRITVEGEEDNARELAQARWQRYAALPRPARIKKVQDHLLRRGFDFDLIRRMMNTLGSEETYDENG